MVVLDPLTQMKKQGTLLSPIKSDRKKNTIMNKHSFSYAVDYTNSQMNYHEMQSQNF
jgi:hypothetical protein